MDQRVHLRHCVLVAFVLAGAASGQNCQPHWRSPFPRGGPDGEVRCAAVFDDGEGPALYIGGEFGSIVSLRVSGIAKWTGSAFAPVPGAPVYGVTGMCVLDEESGPALVVTDSQAWKFKGGRWESLGAPPERTIRAAGVHDEGHGPGLFVAATRHFGAPPFPPTVWRRTAAGWEALPGVFEGQYGGEITCLRSVDLGSRPQLYAGGNFQSVDGRPSYSIARWDGTAWNAVALGLFDPWSNSYGVTDIAGADLGAGPSLYAAGRFGSAGGEYVRNIARWDGVLWHAVADQGIGYIASLAPVHGPAGTRLYAAGMFGFPGSTLYNPVAVFDGQSWSPVGAPDLSLYSGPAINILAPFDDGAGPKVFAGGRFGELSGTPAANLAAWDGVSWNALRESHGLTGMCLAMETFDDGHGPALYAGGIFRHAGGALARGLARWDGAAWSAVDPGLDMEVDNLAVFDDGRGPALYLMGLLEPLSQSAAFVVLRWDGTALETVPAPAGPSIWLNAIATAEDADGPGLFITGNFPGGIVKWDGVQMRQLGTGVAGSFWPYIETIASCRESGTVMLYVGGEFNHAGGVAVRNIAKWDGVRWLHPGIEPLKSVAAMVAAPAGDKLYVAGGNLLYPAMNSAGVAVWDGQSWSGLGADGSVRSVNTLRFFDDGTGPSLFAGGTFSVWGWLPGQVGMNVARWDGLAWQPLGEGAGSAWGWDDGVLALAPFDDGSGPALFVAGEFQSAGGASAGRIASWSACPGGVCYPNCDRSTAEPVLNVADFACFISAFAVGAGYANCDGSSSAPVLNVGDFVCFLNRFAVGCQ